MPNQFVKDPDAILDYAIDWTSWLNDDTISTVTWTVPSGITKTAQSNNASVSTIWLSGGTSGVEYSVTCRIVTAGARTDERTIKIYLKQK